MQDQITAYADGELEADQREATERHLAACPSCAAALANLKSIKTAMRADALLFNAPGALLTRIDTLIDKSITPTGKPAPTKTPPLARWMPIGITAGVVIAGAVAAYFFFWPDAQHRIDSEAVAIHQRAASSNHFVDMATNDPSKLATWFTTKISFQPMIPQRLNPGMTLVGGRVDSLAGRQVAVLVFRNGGNIAEVFQWPSNQPDTGSNSESIGSANVASWTGGGRSFAVVSEASPPEIFNLSGLFTLDGCSTRQ